ncbi:MAG: amino acid permease, partial [bacterium]
MTWRRVKEFVIGADKNPLDRRVFHTATLIVVLAWVGMGADGLSSSCYGPEFAYLALGRNICLAIPLAFFVVLAVFIISASYTQIIEQFASLGAGGGYLVASRFLGSGAGVLAGGALVIDYVLTIATSIAASSEAFFSFMPVEYQGWKLGTALFFLGLLFILNLRGLKESVTALTPIFLVFIVTHVGIIAYGLFAHGDSLARVAITNSQETGNLIASAGLFGTLMILMRAFSLGGGTYTGIEAVSNGLSVLREPKAETGRKTMTYMAFSLAFTAAGLLFCYLLNDIRPQPGRTLNAVLFHQLWDGWMIHGLGAGKTIIVVSLLAEAALLIVAAQSGFIAGPQVLSSMATDYWVPRRFANLSDRLVNQDGIVLMAAASALTLMLTRGRMDILIVMYSINVFITFTLSQLGMCR